MIRITGIVLAIVLFIVAFFSLAPPGATGYAAEPAPDSTWERYERAHNRAEAWRQKLREKESMRLQRRALYLQERDSIQRRQDRLRHEREHN